MTSKVIFLKPEQTSIKHFVQKLLVHTYEKNTILFSNLNIYIIVEFMSEGFRLCAKHREP